MQTSILDRLCAPLCNALTGREDGREMLEILERNNLFLIPLDDHREWFRYHKLFSDVLQAYLLGFQPDMIATLHKRASEWHEQVGSAPDAIHHSLAARDFERAAALVELAVPEMRRNRKGTTITELGWLKALPGELVRIRPVLSVDLAYALVGSGELENVEPLLQNAERWLDLADGMRALPKCLEAGMVVEDEEEFRRLPGMIALLRGAKALARGDMPETVVNARRALDLASKDDLLMLGGASSQLGLAAWAMGDLETAYQMTAGGMAPLRAAGYTSAAIGCALTLADIQIMQGRLREAMATYERALQWATSPSMPSQRGVADMHVGMSTLYYEHNDLNAAMQHLLTSQSLGELAGMPQNPYRWCAAMARILEARGDLDGALDLLDQAERVYDANFSPNVRPIAVRRVRTWIAQGRLDKALGWVSEQGLSVDD
ncbi:helix-turn-helix transcriptional regulator, partial [bacterium]|nr:helix-turn-helix transcriptional regulator [bacterium]